MQQRSENEDDYCGLVLTYRINDIYFCAPVEQVEAVIEPPQITTYPQAPDYVAGAFQYRDEIALAVCLRTLLKLPEAQAGPKRDCLLVVRINGKAVGYWIDEIKGMSDSGKGEWSDIPSLMPGQSVNKALLVDDYVYLPIDLHTVNNINELGPILAALKHDRLVASSVKPEQTERQGSESAVEEKAEPELKPEQITTVSDLEETSTQAELANESLVDEQLEDTAALATEIKTDDAGLNPSKDEVMPAANDELATTDLTQEEEQTTAHEQNRAVELPPEEKVPVSEIDIEAESSAAEPSTDENPEVEESTPVIAEEITDVVETAALVEDDRDDAELPSEETLSSELELELDAEPSAEPFTDENPEVEEPTPAVTEEIDDAVETTGLAEEDMDDAELPLEETLGPEIELEEDPSAAEPGTDENPEVEESISTDEGAEDTSATLSLETEVRAEYEAGLPLKEDMTASVGEPDGSDELRQDEDLPVPESEVDDELPTSAPGVDEGGQDESAKLSPAAGTSDETETALPVVTEELTEEPAQEESFVAGSDDGRLSVTDPGTAENPEDEIRGSSLELEGIEDSEPALSVEGGREAGVGEQELMAELPDDAVLDLLEFTDDVPVAETRPGARVDKGHIDSASLSDSPALDEVADITSDVTSAQAEVAAIPPFSRGNDRTAGPFGPDITFGQEPSEQDEPSRLISKSKHRTRNRIIQMLALPLLLGMIMGGVVLWWKMLDWSEKEQFVMQLPPVLRNEVAHIYSSKVSFIEPERGPDRLIIDLPQHEVRVIGADKVSAILLKQREAISVSMYKVKKGDTLLKILQENLEHVERYPDLQSLSSGPGAPTLNPGDVVTIMDKKKTF